MYVVPFLALTPVYSSYDAFFKEYPNEAMLLVFLHAGLQPAILFVKIDCLIVSFECFNSNRRSAVFEKLFFAMSRQLCPDTRTMHGNIDHHQVGAHPLTAANTSLLPAPQPVPLPLQAP